MNTVQKTAVSVTRMDWNKGSWDESTTARMDIFRSLMNARHWIHRRSHKGIPCVLLLSQRHVDAFSPTQEIFDYNKEAAGEQLLDSRGFHGFPCNLRGFKVELADVDNPTVVSPSADAPEYEVELLDTIRETIDLGGWWMHTENGKPVAMFKAKHEAEHWGGGGAIQITALQPVRIRLVTERERHG